MIISSIEHAGRGYTMMTPAQLVKAGVPQALIDAAIADCRRALIRDECRRRIYAVASAETQMNWASATAVISAKSAAQRSEPERATLAALGDAIGWVQAMRANVGTLAADAGSDFTLDTAWPTCPQSVIDAVAQF